MIAAFTVLEEDKESKNARIEGAILRIAVGERAALGELYELTATDIYAFALSRLASVPDAEDVMHDTFLLIFKNASLYSPMGKPMAWIFTIVINIIKRQYVVKKRIISLEATDADIEDTGFGERVVLCEFLREILHRLTAEEREIISLHIVSGLKHREIAKLLSKPLSTVLSRYSRALKKLRAYAEEKENDK